MVCHVQELCSDTTRFTQVTGESSHFCWPHVLIKRQPRGEIMLENKSKAARVEDDSVGNAQKITVNRR